MNKKTSTVSKIKNGTPVIVTISLILVGLASTIFLLQQGIELGLNAADIASNIIQIWICVGAFISTVFVVFSYIQTNRVFVLSQMPHLLLFVNELDVARSQDNKELVHMTVINYVNNSNNPFYDLSLFIKITTQSTIVDLSDLFAKTMYMAAHDSRQRNFVTIDELKRRGFDLTAVVAQNQQIILTLAYKFTFNNAIEEIKVQEYFWDTSRDKPHWTIK